MENKVKKIRGTVSLLFLCIVLGACADSGPKPSTEHTQETVSTENAMGFDLSAMDYNPETDAQPFFTSSRIAKSGRGYYYWDIDGMEFLMYYDLASGQKVPLCNRPDCRHDDTDCNAWYPSIFDPRQEDVGYDTNYLYFYDGSLYLIGCDKEGYVNLYRVSEDGSSREASTRLYKADFTSTLGLDVPEWTAPEVCIHRGYVYFVNPAGKQPVLRRMELGGSEPEAVYTTGEGKFPSIYRLKAYGDYLFFQTHDSSVEDSLAEEGLFVYDIKKGEVRQVMDGVISTYQIADQTLYYYFEGGIHSCSLSTGEDRVIVEKAPDMTFSTDGQNLYFFQEENGTLDVYGMQGEFVSRMEDEHLYWGYYGCDSQYMFAAGTMQERKSSGSVEVPVGEVKLADLLKQSKGLMAVMNLSDLKVGKGEWKYLHDFDYLKKGDEKQ